MLCFCHLLFSLLLWFDFVFVGAFFSPGKLVFFADHVVLQRCAPYFRFRFLSLHLALGRLFCYVVLWEFLDEQRPFYANRA